MATEAATTNGNSGAASDALSPAEQLQRKHAADEARRARIEDIIDEEDIVHPPPSSKLATELSDAAPAPILEPADEPISEKAAGKQKAQGEPVVSVPEPKAGNKATLDTKSEELFPALGGGPKPRAPAPVATAWGAKKSPAFNTTASNGANGHAAVSSAASSRASTPVSGILTPASTNPSQPRGGPQYMSMPGRHSERVQFVPTQLLPRNQLKKPLQDVLRDINKRSKATVEMKPGPGGIVYFEGKGPVDAVRQALKDVAKEVGSKQAVKVPIPANIRPHIIGRQGAVVQGISKRTGARIQIPKVEESESPEDDDDSATVDVLIEGDAVAAEMARREIEAIVNERTSTVNNLRLKDIPAEFFPFISGPRNSRINALEEGRDLRIKVPEYHTWSTQPPPQAPSSKQPPQFVPHPSNHIQISGDRTAAQEARAEIERHVEELRRQITLSQLAIHRGQHQFIVGDRGISLDDLLEETGCAVILPPDSDDTEMLTITGPFDKIDLGIDRVMNLATSMQMSSVDIARQHPNAPMGPQAHARALTRYLQQRQAIEQLERLHDAHIVLPTVEDGPMTWEVYSREGKNTIRARSDIMNLINAHPPTRLRHVEVNPFYHQHLRQKVTQQVRDAHGVHLLFPEEEFEQSPQLILVYEGQADNGADYELPKQRPSPDEVAAFETALRNAQDFIFGMINGQQEIAVRGVEVPSKFHDKVRKYINREQQNLPAEKIPVQLTTAASRGTTGRTISSQNTSTAASQDHEMTLRGPTDDVNDLVQKILSFVEAEKLDELERGYTTSFDFPQKYANFLIGRKGENINHLREEFDVDIQVNDGKVEVKGPKAKAEAAKSKIVALGKKLEDEATHVLKIKPQYHRDLIGAKGCQVNRLQERYNVRVQFPRSASSTTHGDDQSVADSASEVGGHRNNRTNQAPDEVIIRGPRKGADEARDELLSLLQWTVDNSHVSTVSVAQNQLPSLIGQGGREMESMRMATGAQIDVPGNRDLADPSGRIEIKLKGTKTQVEEAKKLLEERAKIFDDSITRSINVDKKYHKALIGGGGVNIRNLVMEAGGSDDRRELARTVRFPRQDSDESTIRVEGNKKLVDNIVASIEAFVSQRENQINDVLEVAPEKHRLLIGRGGETRRALESQFGVSIDIPKQSEEGPSRSKVKLAGQQSDVEKAKAHILDLVKDQEGETIQVPRRAHHTISDNGQFFRRLRNEHKVTVDHAGQQPPQRPTSKPRAGVNGGAALPLITDDQENVDKFSWELVDSNEGNCEEGDIPWVLRGRPENVVRARAILQKALEQAQQQSAVGYLILPDPRTYRYVVGQGGSQINSIRRQTGCKITVPRDQAKGEAIEIMGSRDGVEEARDIILEVVNNGGNGGSGSRRDSVN